MNRFFIFILLFLSLYGPRLKALDFMAVTTFSLALMSIFFLFCKKEIEKILFTNLVTYGVLFIFFGFHYLQYNKGDITAIGFCFKSIIYLLASYFLVVLYRNQNKALWGISILEDIVYATALNSVFVIVFFFFPSVSNIASQYLDYSNQNKWTDTGHRIFDISIGGGAVASMTFAMVFILSIIFVYRQKKKKTMSIVAVIIFLGVLFLGRSGFLVSIFSIFIFISMKIFCFDIRYLIKLFVNFIILLISLVFIYSADVVDVSFIDSAWFEWLFELFISLDSNGSYETATSEAIGNMWLWPDSFSQLLFGDGNYGRTDFLPYISSDIGIVRIVFGSGVLGLFMLCLPLLKDLYFMIKRFLNSNGFERVYFFLPIVYIFMFLMFNFKEMYFAPRSSLTIYFISLLVVEFFFVQKVETCNVT